MKRLRILMLHPALAPYRLDLFNSLAEKCDFKVIFLRRNLLNQKFNQSELCKQLKCSNEFLSNGFTIKHYCFRFGLLKIIKKFSPDIVISSEFNLQTIQLAIAKKMFLLKHDIKLVVMVDDSPQMLTNNFRNKHVLKRFCLSLFDGLMVISDVVKDLYAQRYRLDPCKIALSPVLQDTEALRGKVKHGYDVALNFIEKYNLSNKKIILYVGRLARVKNLPFLIRAFAKCTDDATRLVLVGDGEMDGRLKALAVELNIEDKVIFAGRFEGPELYAWYLIGQIFVLPSIFEPFGAVINEALAAGMPCLVSKVAGAASLVSGEKQGVLFDPDDLEEFKRILSDRINLLPLLTGEKINLSPSLLTVKFDDVSNHLINFFKSLMEQ